MKIKYIIALLIVAIFSGCGGSDSSSAIKKDSSNEAFEDKSIKKEEPNIIVMQKNRAYFIEKGDKIVKVSSSPIIKIQAELGNKKTAVTLVSGEAKIIKR